MIQFTPPGSGASVIFGTNVTAAAPGSAKGLYLVVSDIEAARKELLSRGVKVSEAFHGGATCTPAPTSLTCSGASGSAARIPNVAATSRWPRSAIRTATAGCSRRSPTRLPGRVEGDTTFASAADLAATLRRAAAAHGEHEKRTGEHDVNWPDWYAEYIVNEQAGKPLPQ